MLPKDATGTLAARIHPDEGSVTASVLEAVAAALTHPADGTPMIIRVPCTAGAPIDSDDPFDRARMLVAGLWSPSPPLYAHLLRSLRERWREVSDLLREVPYGWLAMILMYASPGGSGPQPWQQ